MIVLVVYVGAIAVLFLFVVMMFERVQQICNLYTVTYRRDVDSLHQIKPHLLTGGT